MGQVVLAAAMLARLATLADTVVVTLAAAAGKAEADRFQHKECQLVWHIWLLHQSTRGGGRCSRSLNTSSNRAPGEQHESRRV